MRHRVKHGLLAGLEEAKSRSHWSICLVRSVLARALLARQEMKAGDTVKCNRGNALTSVSLAVLSSFQTYGPALRASNCGCATVVCLPMIAWSPSASLDSHKTGRW
jgi:hypothetical protein